MEISNMDCYLMFRNRSGVLPRNRHSNSIVWPARTIIPTAYKREWDEVFAPAAKINREIRKYRTHKYVDELNAQRYKPHAQDGDNQQFHDWPGNCDEEIRDVVFPRIVPEGIRPSNDVQRQTAPGQYPNVRALDNKLIWQTAKA